MITLNEPALRLLLETEAGPVGRDLRRRAEAVVERATERIAVIIENPLVRPTPDFQIDQDTDGLYAVVGIRDEGSVARYLAEKEARERVWLVPALKAGV